MIPNKVMVATKKYLNQRGLSNFVSLILSKKLIVLLAIIVMFTVLTDCVHMRLKLGESPKSRILTKLGWIDLLMNVIDHALRFCYGSTLTVATAHPKSDFY